MSAYVNITSRLDSSLIVPSITILLSRVSRAACPRLMLANVESSDAALAISSAVMLRRRSASIGGTSASPAWRASCSCRSAIAVITCPYSSIVSICSSGLMLRILSERRASARFSSFLRPGSVPNTRSASRLAIVCRAALVGRGIASVPGLARAMPMFFLVLLACSAARAALTSSSHARPRLAFLST